MTEVNGSFDMAYYESMINNIDSKLMVCDVNRIITFCNPSVIQFLEKNQKIISSEVGSFDPNNLIGVCIDKFHKNPRHQANLLSNPNNLPYATEIELGGVYFGLKAMPLYDSSGVFKGVTVEWLDNIQEKRKAASLESMVESVATNLMICGTDRVITYCNPSVIKLLNRHITKLREVFGVDFSPNNLIGKCIDIFHKNPDKQAKILSKAENLPYQTEICVKGIWFGLNAMALKDQNNEFIGIAVEWLDTVEQSRKAASLESMVQSVETNLMICDVDRVITYCNPSVINLLLRHKDTLRKVFGNDFDPNQLVGKCIDQFHANPDKQAKILSSKSNLPYKTEIEVEGILFGLNAMALTDQNGGFIGIAVEWLDTVAQARKAASLSSMIENVETQLMICNTDRVITYCNPAVVKLLKKYQSELVEALGRFDAERLVGECIDKFHKDPTKQAKILGDPKNLPYKTEIRVGRLVFGLNAMPLTNEKGKFIGIAVEWLDNTAKDVYKKEVGKLINACKDGDLKVRGDASKLDEFYQPILMGTNDIIDAIVAPIEEIKGCLGQIAEGDMRAYVTGQYQGDHELLKNSLNDTLDSLNDILGSVKECAAQISSGANEVSSSSQSISQAATEQAASLEEISSSMNEMASQTKNNAENAGQASRLAESTQQGAQSGNELMEQMMGAMSEIEESSKSISKIIKVIDEIAFQTNLLALNAAVEAARAGAHGKGFAVVAEEVRNLAARSANAAKETTELIEGSSKKVAAGTDLAQKTASSLKEIVTQVGKVTDLVSEIAASSNEQAQGISQVNTGLDQLDQVTQQNTASAEESASASVELKQQGNHLLKLLEKFILNEKKNVAASNIPPEMMKLLEQLMKQKGGLSALGFEAPSQKPHAKPPQVLPPQNRRSNDAPKNKGVNPDDIVPMGDFDDLGRY